MTSQQKPKNSYRKLHEQKQSYARLLEAGR